MAVAGPARGRWPNPPAAAGRCRSRQPWSHPQAAAVVAGRSNPAVCGGGRLLRLRCGVGVRIRLLVAVCWPRPGFVVGSVPGSGHGWPFADHDVASLYGWCRDVATGPPNPAVCGDGGLRRLRCGFGVRIRPLAAVIWPRPGFLVGSVSGSGHWWPFECTEYLSAPPVPLQPLAPHHHTAPPRAPPAPPAPPAPHHHPAPPAPPGVRCPPISRSKPPRAPDPTAAHRPARR